MDSIPIRADVAARLLQGLIISKGSQLYLWDDGWADEAVRTAVYVADRLLIATGQREPGGNHESDANVRVIGDIQKDLGDMWKAARGEGEYRKCDVPDAISCVRHKLDELRRGLVNDLNG